MVIENPPFNNGWPFTTAGSTSEQSSVDFAEPPRFDDELAGATGGLRDASKERYKPILGLDFTASNLWAGKFSFNNESLHAIGDGDTLNPYQEVIHIIGKVLSGSDDDLIPCYGFGDDTTRDEGVFSFQENDSPCQGFKHVLECYREIVPHVHHFGPTSYAPMVEAAIDIVKESGGQYHVLVIISSGQIITGSQQEQETIRSIVDASSYPLLIVLVGVGDGPWRNIKQFHDEIPARQFDNFQFVNFTAIMSKATTTAEKALDFAAALTNVLSDSMPADELGIMSRTTGRAKKITPKPPPVLSSHRAQPERPVSAEVAEALACTICFDNVKDTSFDCGHTSCVKCALKIPLCHICRREITTRKKVFLS